VRSSSRSNREFCSEKRLPATTLTRLFWELTAFFKHKTENWLHFLTKKMRDDYTLLNEKIEIRYWQRQNKGVILQIAEVMKEEKPNGFLTPPWLQHCTPSMKTTKRSITMAVEKTNSSSSLAEVIDRILDKGIVIDAWVRVSLVGIELLALEARVVIASVETYLKYAEAVGLTQSAAVPA
jgi:hypothetical protein